jgi:Cys-tRNA(Pro)/Cys-tRNA(Cys) deacylase
MARRRSVGTPATVALEKAGVTFTVHAYDHDPRSASYGLEAADALGLDPDAVFKTLLADVDGELVVAVVPVSGQLDLKALASAVGGKRAAMADPAVAERTTGYVVGGISRSGNADGCAPSSTSPRRPDRPSTSAAAGGASTWGWTRPTWCACSTPRSPGSAGPELSPWSA